MIEIQRDKGLIEYEKEEIILFIEEQLKMIPGIIYLRKPGMISMLRKALQLHSGKVRIYQINKNEVYIELDLILSQHINYVQIEEEIRKVLKYSLYKKYGLDVTNIEIHIQDLL